MIPSAKPEIVIHYDDPVCCGQFSSDGNFFYACVKVKPGHLSHRAVFLYLMLSFPAR